jgi:hypothetical protein
MLSISSILNSFHMQPFRSFVQSPISHMSFRSLTWPMHLTCESTDFTTPRPLPRLKPSTLEVNQALPQQCQARCEFTSSQSPVYRDSVAALFSLTFISIPYYQRSSTRTDLRFQPSKHGKTSSAYASPIRSRHTVHSQRIPPARC